MTLECENSVVYQSLREKKNIYQLICLLFIYSVQSKIELE